MEVAFMAEKQDVTRRDFVKAAGVAAAVSAPAIQKVRAANDQVQFGFIGTGSRGQYLLQHINRPTRPLRRGVRHLQPNLAKGVEITGNKPKTFRDYRELLSQKDVDCVYIVTPLFMHFPVTRDALMAGKHVFCEKSLVFKPEECMRSGNWLTSGPNRSCRSACSAGTASIIRPCGR